MLADVTPRRYFCTACHVPQTDVQPLVPNTFRDALQAERSMRPHERMCCVKVCVTGLALVSRPSRTSAWAF